MSDLLSIGASGVAAYQRALSTVSNNIANVGTEGYVRQETALTETMPRNSGRVYLGTGVAVVGIKRAYDAFLEQNLRNSTSELNTQGPMVDYANRVIDVMASDTVGLTSALDKFFATARSLSADPASTIVRSEFLRDADGLASRFRELSTQMTSVDTETREAIDNRVADINTLGQQIATVNRKMAKHALVDRQPPDLLDQRDLLLTKLSELVKINVTTAQNGAVDISIGNVSGAGRIVKGDLAVPLEARFDERDLSRVTLVADPYSKTPEQIIGVSSGELGGLLGFREQVLQPTMASLDFLATKLADEINAVHRNGIDLNGNVGTDLFEIRQMTKVDAMSGAEVTFSRAAAGIRVNLSDPDKVAAGSLFRVIENDANLSGADATLSYAASYVPSSQVKVLSQVLKNNADPSAGIVPPSRMLLGQIPIGADNWSLFLNNASGDQQMQIFTRDGRQLVGSELGVSEREQLLTTENGFVEGSSYSSDYLNQTGASGYKQIGLFYGQVAKPGAQLEQGLSYSPGHNPLPTTVLNEVETAGHLPAGLESIAGNRLTLNGRVLPGLLPTPPATTIQASDVVAWLNRTAEGMLPAVSASASNEVKLLLNGSDPAAAFSFNGITISAQSGRTIAGLRDAINDEFRTRLKASIDPADANTLVLTNAESFEGNDIVVNGATYKGSLTLASDGSITLGYGPDGKLGDLELLGQPKGTYSTEIFAYKPYAAEMTGTPIPSSVERIPAGALTLNGKPLPGLDLGRALEASDYVRWIRDAGAMFAPPVTAAANNAVRIPAGFVTDSAIAARSPASLTINGVSITGSLTTAADIVAAINSSKTGKVTLDSSLIGSGSSVLINGTRVQGPLTAAALQTVPGVSVSGPANGKFTLTGSGSGDLEVSAQSNDNALALLTVPASGLKLDAALTLNGVIITGTGTGGTFRNAKDLVDAINASTAGVKANASFDQGGNLASDIRLLGADAADVEGSALGSSRSGAVVPNFFKIPAAQFDIGKPLTLNGVRVTGSGVNGAFISKTELVARINESIGTNVYAKLDEKGDIELQTDLPGGIAVGADLTAQAIDIDSAVLASLNEAGEIVLSNATGADIRIGTTVGSNLLGIGNGVYKGRLSLQSDGEIRVGFGEAGMPLDLAALGFSSGVYIDGPVPEDLLVFVTGTGGGSVSGSYDVSMADPGTLAQKRIDMLRAEDYEVRFSSANRYQIVWTNPANGRETVLAERDYDATGIDYQGLRLTLDRPPAAGDRFLIDGNQDGAGNNENMLDLIALERKGVIGGRNGRTIAQAYEETVGKVGNLASQAAIAQKALQVVNDQAIESRDKVSGVSLDEEAADLIRFQQAYQAAAKTIQVASELFDAILQASR